MGNGSNPQLSIIKIFVNFNIITILYLNIKFKNLKKAQNINKFKFNNGRKF